MKIPKFGQLHIGLIKLLIDDLKMPSLFLSLKTFLFTSALISPG